MKMIPRPPHQRRAFTRVELAISIAVVALLFLVMMPWMLQRIEDSRRDACGFNLMRIGKALGQYHTSHGAYPLGSPYQLQPDVPCEPSWWQPTLAFSDEAAKLQSWQPVPGSGLFSGALNPNTPLVDGYWPKIMLCPSSPMPPMTEPDLSISPANQALIVSGRLQGLVVPSYVALAGSAPDMRDVDDAAGLPPAPAGRNTRDGAYGVLSASGVFPPGHAVNQDEILDGLGYTIVLGEQSDWGLAALNSTLRYDPRSASPLGAYMGSEGQYGQLSPTAEGIDGSGEARCFNVTTLRYALNTRTLHPGQLGESVELDPADGNVPPAPAMNAGLLGPGHNQGLFSSHAGGVNVLYADGRVEFQDEEMSLPILLRLITRDDGADAAKP